MDSKIMNTSNLEDISLRLTGCIAILQVIHGEMSNAGDLCDAIYGVQDLLRSITKDFNADIDGASDFDEEATA